jgi:hypothetical protein
MRFEIPDADLMMRPELTHVSIAADKQLILGPAVAEQLAQVKYSVKRC